MKTSDYHEFIDNLESIAMKTFVFEDALNFKGKNAVAARKLISKLIEKGLIRLLADNFYVIYSPSERINKEISPDNFIDQMMRFKGFRYYVGLLSAASYYGATHHRPMVYQVIIDKQLKIPKKLIHGMDFHNKKKFPINSIKKVNGHYGYINMPSKALVAYDVLKYQSKVGGFENGFLIFSELSKTISQKEIYELLKNQLETAVIQRMGFLFEKFGKKKLADIVYLHINNNKIYTQLSLSDKDTDLSVRDKKWKIIPPHSLEITE